MWLFPRYSLFPFTTLLLSAHFRLFCRSATSSCSADSSLLQCSELGEYFTVIFMCPFQFSYCELISDSSVEVRLAHVLLTVVYCNVVNWVSISPLFLSTRSNFRIVSSFPTLL